MKTIGIVGSRPGGQMKVICEQADKCGLAEHCQHGKAHECRRCGNCGAWCDRSNALCNGGLCTQPRDRVIELGLLPYNPSWPVRCRDVEPMTVSIPDTAST